MARAVFGLVRLNYRPLWPLFRRTFSKWSDHNATRLSASIAFYTLLSLAPLVILATAIAAIVFGRTAAQARLLNEVNTMIGHQAEEFVRGMIRNADQPARGTLAAVVSLSVTLFGASGVFGELRAALNTMWDVTQAATGGIVNAVKQRLSTFWMVLAVGFILLISLAIDATLQILGKYVWHFPAITGPIGELIGLGSSAVATTVIFAGIFKYVPETKVEWRDVWGGAIVTAILFMAGRVLIGFYITKVAVGSAYGAAASLVVIIVWVYYSAIIFLFGAEFTHVLIQDKAERRRASRAGLAHNPRAVQLRERDRGEGTISGGHPSH